MNPFSSTTLQMNSDLNTIGLLMTVLKRGQLVGYNG